MGRSAVGARQRAPEPARFGTADLHPLNEGSSGGLCLGESADPALRQRRLGFGDRVVESRERDRALDLVGDPQVQRLVWARNRRRDY